MELKSNEQNQTLNVGEPKVKRLIVNSELTPAPEEIALWERIEKAELPIRTMLKRINKIAKAKFPRYKLQTVSSCSGHMKGDGSAGLGIGYTPGIMLYTRSKVHFSEMTSYFGEIFGKAIDKTNEKFQDKVIAIDTEADPDFIVYDYYFNGTYYSLPPDMLSIRYPELSVEKFGNPIQRKTYAISYDFPILTQKNVFSVLEQFWTNLDRVLTEKDGLNIHTLFKKEDFVKKSFE